MKKSLNFIIFVLSLMFIGINVVNADYYKEYSKGTALTFSPDGTNNYKWIILEDSKKNNDKLTLLFNQGGFSMSEWNDSGNSQEQPTLLLDSLKTATSSWSKVEKINSAYDNINYTNANARLVSAQDIANISGLTFNNPNDGTDAVAIGPVTVDHSYRFITSTPTNKGTESIWIVSTSGELSPYDMNNGFDNMVIKPVIVVKKVTVDANSLIIEPIKVEVPATVDLKAGETYKINATVTPTNAKDKSLTWTSSDSSIVSVDNNGNIKALKVGEVTISAKTSNNVVGQTKIKVGYKMLEEEKAMTRLSKIALNETKYQGMSWVSSDSSVANVENNSIVAKKIGKTILTGTNDSSQIKITLSVSENIKYITYDINSIFVGDEINYSDKYKLKDENLTWSTDNNSIATISKDGILKAIAPGIVTIKGISGSLVVENVVSIKEKNSNNISMVTGTTLNIKPGTTYNISSKTDLSNLNWTSSDNKIATIDKNGIVTAIATGTLIITGSNSSSVFTNQINVLKEIKSKNNNNIAILASDNVLPANSEIESKEIKTTDKEYSTIKKNLKDVKKFMVYDINLISESEKKQPYGELILEFDYPEGYDLTKLVAYRVDDNNSLTELESEIVNGKLQVKTNHFSYYVIAESTKKTNIANDGSVENPKTGQSISIILVISGFLVAFGIYKYTKKNNKFIKL